MLVYLRLPTIFKKIRFDTHDNIGSGPISFTSEEMHTSATWMIFDQPENWKEDDLTDAYDRRSICDE